MVERRPWSRRRRGCYPSCHGLSSKVMECAAADQMASDVECVVDGGMGGEKSLG